MVADEIRGPGSLYGYRSVWHSLRLKYGVHVSRHVVARLMREIDPDGVQSRKGDACIEEHTEVKEQMLVGF